MAAAPQSFRPDNPANALIYVWPGVPIAALGLGFALSCYRLWQGVTVEFALLAAFLGTGWFIVVSLLIQSLCFRWYVVTVDARGVHLLTVARERIGLGNTVTVPWSAVNSAAEVTEPDGTSALAISAGWRTYRISRALYRADTYQAMEAALLAYVRRRGNGPLSSAPEAA